MSTRSNIGIIGINGEIRQIYCHCDGYLAHNGKILIQHYNTTEKVESLLALGDLSVLGETPEGCIAYHRDRGEAYAPPQVMQSDRQTYTAQEEYAYLWDEAAGEWLWCDRHGHRSLRMLTSINTNG